MESVVRNFTLPRTLVFSGDLKRIFPGIFFLLVAVVFLFSFSERNFFDINTTVVTQVFLVLSGVFATWRARGSMLPILFIVVFSAPFLHGIEHFGHVYSVGGTGDTVWGLFPNEYNMNPKILDCLFMVGVLGTASLLAGIQFGFFFPAEVALLGHRPGRKVPSLDFLHSAAFLAIAVVLIRLGVSGNSLLVANYEGGESQLESVNMNAGWIVAFTLVLAVFVDLLFEVQLKSRMGKAWILVMGMLILVPMQLVYGERECVPLVATLIVMILFRPAYTNLTSRSMMKRVGYLAMIGIPLIIIAQFIGEVRSFAAEHNFADFWARSGQHHFTGTWSGSLLSVLSVVGDFYQNLVKPTNGATYLDYFYSLPPGFVTRLLGIVRPIDGTSGLAWQMRYGIGGTNIVVAPFLNFGVLGVFIMMFFVGMALALLDRRVTLASTFNNEFLYCVMLLVTPFWVWYGDMYLIRALMAFGIVSVVLLPLRRKYR